MTRDVLQARTAESDIWLSQWKPVRTGWTSIMAKPPWASDSSEKDVGIHAFLSRYLDSVAGRVKFDSDIVLVKRTPMVKECEKCLSPHSWICWHGALPVAEVTLSWEVCNIQQRTRRVPCSSLVASQEFQYLFCKNSALAVPRHERSEPATWTWSDGYLQILLWYMAWLFDVGQK